MAARAERDSGTVRGRPSIVPHRLYILYAIPSHQITLGQDSNIWFTELLAHNIVCRLPE